ncbi:CLUMA_CG013271, isoform A [Clunio marinus]|uniref:CLUMA_CG013271, isoform A n=1 Tax=Clunio marinus TaxID=568069 RepID=A0A1J1INC2_9DIPT|nr:CLUMA_CG013271, isoform A [Clunio marinus]
MKRSLCYIIFISITVLCNSYHSKPEGSVCTNYDGSLGICKYDRECEWAKVKLQNREITLDDLVICMIKYRRSIICCNDETVLTTTVSTRKTVTDRFIWGTEPLDKETTTVDRPLEIKKRKSEQACGLIENIRALGLDYHILNGKEADVGEYPHMAAIGYGDAVEEDQISFDCGGSLISQKFVLTAAHCVNSRKRQPKIIRLGRVSLDENSDRDTNLAQDIPVKGVKLQPSYTSREKYNDIALIEMMRNAEFTRYVKPACLYTSGKSFGPNEKLEITGWGRVNSSTLIKSNWLLKADIHEVPIDECNESYSIIILSQLADGITQSQLCATNTKDGKVIDACQGDSGGPIQMRKIVNHETVFHVVGVTSFGLSCGSSLPGVYTRVSEYLDWIESVVWPSTVNL